MHVCMHTCMHHNDFGANSAPRSARPHERLERRPTTISLSLATASRTCKNLQRLLHKTSKGCSSGLQPSVVNNSRIRATCSLCRRAACAKIRAYSRYKSQTSVAVRNETKTSTGPHTAPKHPLYQHSTKTAIRGDGSMGPDPDTVQQQRVGKKQREAVQRLQKHTPLQVA
jgi:hypothetical protein